MKKSYADMDPVEEIRTIRTEIMNEFKTLDALCEYLNNPRPSTSPRKNETRKKALARRKPVKAKSLSR